ncbi:MAG: hypothetical protein RBS96_02585 [Dehalococcoidales bacterium]|jgi:hypothetical protein|nr:hypothetical protein [Syntrophales bacterium]MDX9802903.1 hypothetical protein [Dehalococcoidales bacterium]
MNKQERIILYLTKAREMFEIRTTSKKYRAFESITGKIWYVGKNGSVRTGGKTIKESIPVTQTVMEKMEFWEQCMK